MNELKKLRDKIDKIDKKLSKTLEKRKNLIKAVGKIKRVEDIPVIDKKREEAILSKFKTEYEKEIFKKIMEESRKLQ